MEDIPNIASVHLNHVAVQLRDIHRTSQSPYPSRCGPNLESATRQQGMAVFPFNDTFLFTFFLFTFLIDHVVIGCLSAYPEAMPSILPVIDLQWSDYRLDHSLSFNVAGWQVLDLQEAIDKGRRGPHSMTERVPNDGHAPRLMCQLICPGIFPSPSTP